MAFNFKKNAVVGVSVTPEIGLEVAQVDFVSKTVQKYGYRQLNYDNNRKEIADMDIFKETLQDLFLELDISKGADVALTLPAAAFKVNDYPASLNEEQISNVIEEELTENPIFKETEPCISAVKLPNSTIQFNKIAYTAEPKVQLIEIAMQIKELGYNLVNIDTSVNSTLNALIYRERVDVSPNTSWVMLLIENNVCRIIPMQGRNYVDYFEEKVGIGEVLGDAENYATVVAAVNPIIKNLPSQYLYVVSKTNVISAEALAGKLIYNGQIIHHEANCFTKESFLEVSPMLDESIGKMISLDAIGSAINRDFASFTNAYFNLFNASLGDIYILNQPPVLKFGSLTYVLSIENMIVASFVLAVIAVIVIALIVIPLGRNNKQLEDQLSTVNSNIDQISKYLKDNESVSSELFDEGDEIRLGLTHNKNIYTYYTIVGTEIPKKLWLTSLSLGQYTTIEGQADNLESVYGFFRNIKDYDPNSAIKLQKLGLASKSKLSTLAEDDSFDTDSILTSMNADFYQFRISDAPEIAKEDINKDKDGDGNKGNDNDKNKKGNKNGKPNLPDLDPIE